LIRIKVSRRENTAAMIKISILTGSVLDRGFTLIEFLIIMSVIGILAVIGIPQLADLPRIEVGAAAERVGNDLRYVQDLAMKTGQVHQVAFTSSDYQVSREGAGIIEDPSHKGEPFIVNLDEEYPGISITAFFSNRDSVAFDFKGRPSKSGSIVLSFRDEAATIFVENKTGRVSF
jgi:prepilin-type N-terminal cleavage/methylation domain-containing protein